MSESTSSTSPGERSAPGTPTPPAAKPAQSNVSRSRRWAKGLAWVLGSILLLWGLSWLALPPLLKWQGEERLTEWLGRPVRIGAVEFQPWALRLTVRDLQVGARADAGTDEPQFRLQRLHVDAQMRSLFKLAPVVRALEMDAPRLRLQRLADGSLDIDDIVERLRPAPAQPDAPAGGGARFALYNVKLNDGEVVFVDTPVDRRHVLSGLQVGLPFLSNLPSDIDVQVEPRVAFALNGTAFDSGAQATPFADDRSTRLSLKMTDLDLAPWLPYVPTQAPVRPQRGRVSADLQLDFEIADDGTPKLKFSGNSSASDVALNDRAGAPLLSWQRLQVALVDVQPLANRVALGVVRMDGAALAVRRDGEGAINLLRLAANPAAVASATPPTGAAVPPPTAATVAPAGAPEWQVSVSRLELGGATIDWDDASTSPPAKLRLQAIDIVAERLQYPVAAPMPVRLTATLAGTDPVPAATLAVEGEVSDRLARLKLGVAELDLRHGAPYLASVLAAPLRGRAALDGELTWAAGEPGALALNIASASVDQLQLGEADSTTAAAGRRGTRGAEGRGAEARSPAARGSARQSGTGRATEAAADRATADVPASLRRIALTDTQVDLVGRRVTVGALDLTQPDLQLLRGTDGRWNFEAWTVAAAPDQLSTAAGARPATRAAGAAIDGGSARRATRAAKGSATQPNTQANAAAPWALELKTLQLDGGRLRFVDEAPNPAMAAEAKQAGERPPVVRLTATDMRASIKDLQWPGGAKVAPAAVTFSARVQDGRTRSRDATPALIDWRGDVAPQPLLARGRLKAERLPLHALEPYVEVALNVDLVRAEAGYTGTVDVRGTPAGLSVKAAGNVLVGDLRLIARGGDVGSGQELLNWQTLALNGVNATVAPGSKPDVRIEKAVLTDLYSRLVITEEGRFNLQDVRPGAGAAASTTGEAATQATAPQGVDGPQSESGPGYSAPSRAPPRQAARSAAGPEPAPPSGSASANAADANGNESAASTTAEGAGLPLDITVGGVDLVGGRIDFTDRFVRPSYSAALTELNGTLGAFSSGNTDMATLDLRGRAAGTALLHIRGALNPTADPLALDIQATATDLELAPLSPYAGKYAGYAIERGKLTMDVSYRIEPDGRLDSKNQVILNQLTFGERIESPDATKLPVLLAVALLKDRNGVIDINLPVSGSINDPQFSVFGLVMKVIGNLLVKALTSPFALLAGGGSEDLSFVEFAPGSASLGDDAVTVVDKVAKALTDRPALKMTVTGASDFAAERAAMRRQAFEARVRAEQRRDVQGAGAAANAPLPALSVEERLRIVRRLYRSATLPDKPRNAVGMLRDLPIEDMEARLMDAAPVTADDARELALQRGLAVRDALVDRGLASERLFLAAPRLRAPDGSDRRGAQAGGEGADASAAGAAVQADGAATASEGAAGAAVPPQGAAGSGGAGGTGGAGGAGGTGGWTPRTQLSLGTN
jgi:uncharacterized protein involved in outer membrane biogenesis